MTKSEDQSISGDHIEAHVGDDTSHINVGQDASSVNVGDVEGGIHDSVIAGHDVHVHGDQVGGDKLVYSEVTGDPITVGEVHCSNTLAVGHGAVATSVKNIFLEIPKFFGFIIIVTICILVGTAIITMILTAHIFSVAVAPPVHPALTFIATPVATPTKTSTPIHSRENLATVVPFSPSTFTDTRILTAISTLTATPTVHPQEHPRKSLIVITHFDSTGPTNAKIHDEIRRSIEQKAHELDFASLQVIVDAIKLPVNSALEAKELGDKYNATIIIWGEDTGVRVTVNYLYFGDSEFTKAKVQLTDTARSQLANPKAYAQYVTQDLPAQMSFLSLLAIGHSYYVDKEYNNALRTIEGAIDSFRSDADDTEGLADAYFRLGWLYQVPEQTRNLPKAINNYSQAIKFNYVNLFSAYNNRGVLYNYQGQYDKAIIDYSTAIELKSNIVFSYVNRGDAYISQRQYELAIIDYSTAIQLSPDLSIAYFKRAVAYHQMGDAEMVQKDLYQASKLMPPNEFMANEIIYRLRLGFRQGLTESNSPGPDRP